VIPDDEAEDGWDEDEALEARREGGLADRYAGDVYAGAWPGFLGEDT